MVCEIKFLEMFGTLGRVNRTFIISVLARWSPYESLRVRLGQAVDRTWNGIRLRTGVRFPVMNVTIRDLGDDIYDESASKQIMMTKKKNRSLIVE